MAKQTKAQRQAQQDAAFEELSIDQLFELEIDRDVRRAALGAIAAERSKFETLPAEYREGYENDDRADAMSGGTAESSIRYWRNRCALVEFRIDCAKTFRDATH